MAETISIICTEWVINFQTDETPSKNKQSLFYCFRNSIYYCRSCILFCISFFFKDQLNEKLYHDIKNITGSIKKNGTIPDYYPFIEIREVSKHPEQSFKTTDTLIFDAYRKKEYPYRQISVITVINGKEYFIAARDTLIEEDDLLEVISIVTGSVFILLLVSLYFINRKLSMKIWEPFYKTLDELKEFSSRQTGIQTLFRKSAL